MHLGEVEDLQTEDARGREGESWEAVAREDRLKCDGCRKGQ